uniref:SEFIR domain-containing protein n=1 Tax=Echeneis naucrates TaxID=173247 RepID=A0A665WIX3_ECHNA
MVTVPFLYICLSAGLSVSSSLWILNERLHCNQTTVPLNPGDCPGTDMLVQRAPTGPEGCSEDFGVTMVKNGAVPIMKLTWILKSDGSVLHLKGSKINILDESTNQSICLLFSYTIHEQMNPSSKTKWNFSLDGVVVDPGQTYMVSVTNLPESESRDNLIRKTISVPRCDDKRIQTATVCLENGSLWEPRMTADLSVDKEQKKLLIAVSFEAAQHSERYQVSVLTYLKNVSKVNTLNGSLNWIQPYFLRCNDHCFRHQETINYCPYYPPRTLIIKVVVGLLFIDVYLFLLLWRAFHKDSVNTPSSSAKHQPEGFQLHKRKRVLIIYSLDHPLYKNIVLKLCSFLATKCGTEVVLDLLDSARVGVLGGIQWLDWHREQIESSSDKILILCSPGVQAKWRAMCGAEQVFLREDVYSPVGDMLTPALSLIVPHFMRCASFEKYIVAYFDYVCSEEDVPSPFNITVRYKLMKQFEELFFRILDTEKHEPGRVNHIEGLSEDEYHQCPSGRALWEAIEAFHVYQQLHPHWFEDQLLESSDLEVEATLTEIYTQWNDFTMDKTGLYVAVS